MLNPGEGKEKGKEVRAATKRSGFHQKTRRNAGGGTEWWGQQTMFVLGRRVQTQRKKENKRGSRTKGWGTKREGEKGGGMQGGKKKLLRHWKGGQEESRHVTRSTRLIE